MIEGPGVRAAAFSLISGLLIGASSNSHQIFNGNSAIGLFGSVNNASANGMVQPRLVSALSTGQPFQNALGVLCAFRLERCPHTAKPISSLFYGCSIPFVSFRSYGNISTAKIYPDNFVDFGWFWSLVFKLDVQIKAAVSVLTKLSASGLSAFELPSLVVTQVHGNMLSAANQCQADVPVSFPEGKDSSVIVSASGSKGFDLLTLGLSRLVTSPNPGAGSNGKIGTQSKLLPNLVVNQGLNGSFTRYGGFNVLIDIVASITKRLKSCLDFDTLFRGGVKLANQGQILDHSHILSHPLVLALYSSQRQTSYGVGLLEA